MAGGDKTPNIYIYNPVVTISKLQDFRKLLRCLEVSSNVSENFDVVDRETKIDVLKSAPLYPASHVIKCLMSLIKEEVLEGQPIRCVLQPQGSFTCTVEKVRNMTLSLLQHYRIQNWQLFSIPVEAAICKIMEFQNLTEATSAASSSSSADK